VKAEALLRSFFCSLDYEKTGKVSVKLIASYFCIRKKIESKETFSADLIYVSGISPSLIAHSDSDADESSRIHDLFHKILKSQFLILKQALQEKLDDDCEDITWGEVTANTRNIN
jgi:hypothetical protein